MPQVRSLVTPRRAIGAGVAALMVGGTVTAFAATLSTPTPGAAPLTALASDIPSWAASAPVVGVTPADASVVVGLTLRGPDDADKQPLATAMSTPGNPLYRHFLTRAEYNARFAPSDTSVSAVKTWLTAAGVTNVQVAPGNALMVATMPASLASTVFKVSFRQVEHAGTSIRVPSADATLPASISPLLLSVSGLTEDRMHYDHVVDSPAVPVATGAAPSASAAAFLNARPCTDYYNGNVLKADGSIDPAPPVQPTYLTAPLAGDTSTSKPYDPCGYTPAQIRGAYGLDKTTYTGKGVNVAIVDAYDGPDVESDTNTYSMLHGLPYPVVDDDLSPPGLAETPEDPTGVLLDPQGWAGEETLDWQAVHTMAPDAGIVYSGAATPDGPGLNIAVVVAEQDLTETVSEITNSYGSLGDLTGATKTEFTQAVATPAAMMGIGLEYSTGDESDNVASSQERVVDAPADSDMVTGVGGTGLLVGPHNDYQGEYYWNTYKASKSADGKSWGATQSTTGGAGGGGGVSTSFAEPAWQLGIADAYANNSDTGTTTPGRVLPDVALDADSTTGFLVGQTQTPDGGPNSGKDTYSEYRIGGTSVSSPLFAGLMADVVQAVGKPVGFVNPTMYPFQKLANGAYRDPSVGRAVGAKRDGSTEAQVLMGKGTDAAGNTVYAGAGPGVVPVLADVRSDYTDPADPTSTVGYTLRTLGNISTLHDDPGFDDSTGLGSPYAPQFIQDFLPSTGSSPTPTPTSASPSPSVTPTSASPSPNVTPTSASPSPSVTPTTDSPSPVASSTSPSPVMTSDSPTPGPTTTSASPTPSQTSASPTATPTATSSPTATPAPVGTIKPTGPATVLTMSCAVRSSSIKVSAPASTKLGRHGQLPYSFKLFVKSGTCKTPSAVGRQFFVYVDGKKVATLRTGKNGAQNYLVRLKPGKHTITASFVGNKDLRKSTSNRVVTHVI